VFVHRFIFGFVYILYIVACIRLRHGTGKIIFTHGSTADTASIASFADSHATQHGRSIFVCSALHKNLFKRFVFHPNAILLFWTEKKCQRFRTAWHIISHWFYRKTSFKFINPSTLIVPAYIPSHPTVHNLVKLKQGDYQKGIYYNEGLRRILSLSSLTKQNAPIYSESDYKLLLNILATCRGALNQVALINPICYTYENISRDAWLGIASALRDKGYSVIFNSQGNLHDNQDSSLIIPKGFRSVKLAAYLCPLAAQCVGLVCGRLGGGFNLLHSFARPNSSLLVLIDHNEVGSYSKRDMKRNNILWDLVSYNGYSADHVAVISLHDSADVVYVKTMMALERPADASAL